MHYFLDSSALIKCYIAEIGTGWIQAITAASAANRFMIAQITPVEIVSGISRRKRENQISTRTARAVRLLVERFASRDCLVIALTPSVTQRAADLLENHPLRAYDAVQLASALESNQRLMAAGLAALTFVSADTRLLTIAASEGLAIDDPNQHP